MDERHRGSAGPGAGSVIHQGNPRGPQPSWPTTRGYVNGVADPTGLTHLGAREYEPTTGRFISADPIVNPADPQQVNGYSYTNNTPVTASDPTGQYVCLDECGGADDKVNRANVQTARNAERAASQPGCTGGVNACEGSTDHTIRSGRRRNGTTKVTVDGKVFVDGLYIPGRAVSDIDKLIAGADNMANPRSPRQRIDRRIRLRARLSTARRRPSLGCL